MVVRIACDQAERLPQPQSLHRVEIGAVLHQPGGKRVPQVMKPHVRESGLATGSCEGPPDVTLTHALALGVEEHVGTGG